MRLPTVSELLVMLSFQLPPRRRPSASLSRPRRARPTIEPLEDRSLPSANFASAMNITTAGDASGENRVVTGAAGNVILSGDFSAPITLGTGAGAVTLTPSPSTPAGYLAKFSPTGSLLWAEVTDEPRSLANDSAGNLYLAGSHDNGRTQTATKFDASGNVLWSISLALGATSITADSAGNAYILYFQYGTNYIAKLNGADGSFAWSKSYYLGAGNTSQNDIAVDGSGNVYATGSYQGKQDFDPGAGTFYLTSPKIKGGYAVNAYVLELNNSGGFVWAGSMGTDTGTNGYGVATDGLGNVYLRGNFGSGTTVNDFNPGPGVAPLSNAPTYVVKLDSHHAFQWADSIAAFSYQYQAFVVDGTGSVYLSNIFQGTVDFDPGPGQANLTSRYSYPHDIFVLKLDTAGNFAWVTDVKPDSAASDDFIHTWGLAVDPAGNVYTSGNFIGTYDFDPAGTANLTSHGYVPGSGTNSQDGYLLKLTQSSPQLAAGGAKTVNSSTDRLTDAQLQPIVAEARARWLAAGADPVRLAAIDVGISDIGGAWLGATYGTSTRIDDNAAGYGWFVDPTPANDSEFSTPGDQGEQGRMDLLTVVMHEMGLGLGLADGGPGIMQRELPTGTRRLPGADLVANLATNPAIPTAVVPPLPASGPAAAVLPAPPALTRAISPAGADLLFVLLSDLQGHRKTPFATI
jgi:hypothetical protein